MKDLLANLKVSYFNRQVDKADVFAKAFPHFEKAVALVERERIEDGTKVTVRADTPDAMIPLKVTDGALAEARYYGVGLTRSSIKIPHYEVPRKSVARKICIVDLQRFLSLHFARTGNHGKLATNPLPARPEPNVAPQRPIQRPSATPKIVSGPFSPLPRAYHWGPAYAKELQESNIIPATLRRPLFW